MRQTIALFVCLFAPVLAFAAIENGEWTLSPSEIPGRVHFSLEGSRGDNHFNTSSDWETSSFTGLDAATAGKHDVHFSIARDAGVIECEGFLKGGAGAGLFTFHANGQYSAQMASLGFTGVDDDRLLSFAIHDVSLNFVRGIKAAGVSDLETDKLIAFRIHGVSPEFIRELQAAGLNVLDANKLIAFRIHGVSPQFVRDLRGAGIEADDPDKLIAFRIHGVSPEFVSQLAHLGYQHPGGNQLIALRIHGVTPEYIEKLRSRGIANPTLDQLIALRIQGID